MYIQYVGFNVVASSRTYSFHVIDTPEEAREFTVRVQAEAFRPTRLQLQDGPGITFTRLEHELQGETPESRAESHLSIGEPDIQDYLERHYPRKPLVRQRGHALSTAPTKSPVPVGTVHVESKAP